MSLKTTEIERVKVVYTVREAASVLNLSEKSVRRLLQRGKLRSLASLRHKRIPRSDLERFLADDLG